MKRVAIVAIAVTVSMAAFAQKKGDMAAGANVVVGIGRSYTNFGAGPKFQYNILDAIRAEGSFTYFFEKDYFSVWEVNLNGHYLVPIGEKMVVYPLAGAGVMGFSKGYYSREFSFNFGGGVDFLLTDKMFFNVELKHKLGDYWDRTQLSAGIAYRF
jgi:outer membrane protein X